MKKEKPIRNAINRKNVNAIFLVGEVVDMGVQPKHNRADIRARLKLRSNAKGNDFVYVDVYGKHSCAEVMALVCQTGNIVYVEGEFRNRKISPSSAVPYILVTHIDCLHRRRDIKPPTTKLISLLDKLDPIGYETNKKKKTK